ncbi:MAG TPA: ABC transporter permease subunit [Gemmatimonadales bacterium]|nr:ABC transporter permease subunit [Gemmatimonadales bacterium]
MTRTARGTIAALLVAAPALIGLGWSAAVAWSSGRIATVLSDGAVWRGLGWSIWIAAAATLLATAGAVLVAALFRSNDPLHRWGRALAIAPLPIPHLVAAAVGVMILSQSGLLARAAFGVGLIDQPGAMPALVYDRAGTGLIVTLAWKEFPFLALLAISLLATRGAAFEEAARTLGASPRAVFRHATWPVLWRGLLPGAAAVFIFAAGSYETALLLAPSNPLALPLLIAQRHDDPAIARRPDADILVLLAFLLSALAVAAHEWARSRAERLDR